jgi:hypothetical protein
VRAAKPVNELSADGLECYARERLLSTCVAIVGVEESSKQSRLMTGSKLEKLFYDLRRMKKSFFFVF